MKDKKRKKSLVGWIGSCDLKYIKAHFYNAGRLPDIGKVKKSMEYRESVIKVRITIEEI